MTTAERLLNEALCLSDVERQKLAEELLRSLPGATARFERELVRRMDDVDKGRTHAVAWDEALARIFGTLPA